MKKQIGFLALTASMLINSANATVLTFDDGLTNMALIPNGYGGFNWGNSADGIDAIKKSFSPGTGYERGVVSGDTGAFNAWGSSGNTIDLVGSGTFDFNSAVFTSAEDPQQISFEGWNNGLLLYTSADYDIDNTTPLLVSLNWSGIDSLVVNNTFLQWTMDDFTFNATNTPPQPIPTPPAFWLLSLGLAGLLTRRYKKIGLLRSR